MISLLVYIKNLIQLNIERNDFIYNVISKILMMQSKFDQPQLNKSTTEYIIAFEKKYLFLIKKMINC